MGNENTKCLYLPAQSGKTRKMQDLIRQHKMDELLFDEMGVINIIISANNKLLVEQTTKRMETDLGADTESDNEDSNAIIQGDVFSWTSGTKESNLKPRELAFDIIEDKIEMIVLCAHAQRFKYLLDALTRLNESRHFVKKVNIWIDEADQSINLWSKYERITDMRIINQITLVSATFDSVMKKYKSLNVLPYFETHPECYRGLRHSNRVERNYCAENAVDYVKQVIENDKATLVKPGMRAFIPGEMAKASHDAIADYLHKEHNFVVIIINGERKEILVPGKRPIDLRCYLTVDANGNVPKEFNVQLCSLYRENGWAQYPLAITGFYCVERGITFQCDGFLFDYGIIPPIRDKCEAYQTMARLFGNVGDYARKAVDIYTTSVMFGRVEKQENIAINIAHMVAEQGLETVTKNDIKAAQNLDVESNYDLHTTECTTLAQANIFMRGHGAQGKTEKSLERCETDARFILSSTTKAKAILLYDDVVKEMQGWSKTSNFDVKKKNAPRVSSRLTICYKNLADPSTVAFICRVLVKKE